jgi:ATP-dependent Clp protease, protease subunit
MPVLKNGELYLYGFVGDNYWDEGFTASEVLDALGEVGRDTDVRVHINSGGGYVDDGIAIYNSLRAHKGNVTIIVDAIAASSASVIAMAGADRIMLAGSMMMMHDPSSETFGTADEHENKSKHLNIRAGQMADIYAEMSGDTADDLREEMKATLWLTPDEAVSRGFATAANEDKSLSVSAFDYRIYAHAPQRLCALASEHQWSLKAELAKRGVAFASPKTGHRGVTELSKTEDAGKSTAASNVPVTAENVAPEPVMSATNDVAIADATKAAVTAYKERRTEILALDEAKGREALAESLIETEMSAQQIKSALAAAPKGAGDESQTTVSAENYEQERTQSNGLAMPVGKKSKAAHVQGSPPTWGSVLANANLSKKETAHDHV